MFPIAQRYVNREIGKNGLKVLAGLFRWIYDASHPLSYRTAPSIVVRSEAALFGISSPRYAYRAYQPDSGPSFINARRLVRLAQNAKHVCASAKPSRKHDAISKAFRDMIALGCCAADSFLEPPARYLNDYHVLTTLSGHVYGEEADFLGTPFVQHVQLGGGMCAQAACYMVLTLLERITRAIYGIAEISLLAQGNKFDADSKIPIDRLHPEDIVKFFNNQHVGLKALRQSFGSGGSDQYLHAAMRSYLLSGIPLLFLVDLGRMRGQIGDSRRTIFSRNHTISGLSEADRRHDHVVVAVGCAKDRQVREFLINDPATMPFLQASLDDLLHARIYRRDVAGQSFGDPLQSFQFVSVTHDKVTLPLAPPVSLPNAHQSRAAGHHLQGLLMKARSLQAVSLGSRPQLSNLVRYNSEMYDPGEFRLIATTDPTRSLNQLPHPIVQQILSLVEAGELPAGWYWIQYIGIPDIANVTDGSIWIWNAQAEANVEAIKCLVAVYGYKGGQWNRLFIQTGWAMTARGTSSLKEGNIVDESSCLTNSIDSSFDTPETPPNIQLRPALVSSYSTLGVSLKNHPKWSFQALRPYGDIRKEPNINSLGAEVFAFMQPEIDDEKKNVPTRFARFYNWLFGTREPETAMEYLASLGKHQINAVAHRIDENFGRFEAPVVALVSRIPEISRGGDSREGRLAIRALKNLISLADTLQELGQPSTTVVLVAGSRIQKISIDDTDSAKPRYFAHCASEKKAQDRLVDTLRRVVRVPTRNPVFLALELEPGPLFVLNAWDCVESLANRFSEDRTLRSCVGFNLDIANWRLASISPEQLRQSSRVRRRIVHAHISGHHKIAHYGDTTLVPTILAKDSPQFEDMKRDFHPWIEILKNRLMDGTGLPRFSEHVSLELEAAKDHHVVLHGTRQLLWLLGN